MEFVPGHYHVKELSSGCGTRFLCQNQVLIVCMTRDQLFYTYGKKGSQKTKCHE
jgi:hypothetical protein